MCQKDLTAPLIKFRLEALQISEQHNVYLERIRSPVLTAEATRFHSPELVRSMWLTPSKKPLPRTSSYLILNHNWLGGPAQHSWSINCKKSFKSILASAEYVRIHNNNFGFVIKQRNNDRWMGSYQTNVTNVFHKIHSNFPHCVLYKNWHDGPNCNSREPFPQQCTKLHYFIRK